MQLEEMRKNEDPRLSFSTPEFKEAQRTFTEGFKAGILVYVCCLSLLAADTLGAPQKNFGKPVEWALVKDYPWSTPQLRKLDAPVSLCALQLQLIRACISPPAGHRWMWTASPGRWTAAGPPS